MKVYLHSFQIVEIKARNLKLVFIFQFESHKRSIPWSYFVKLQPFEQKKSFYILYVVFSFASFSNMLLYCVFVVSVLYYEQIYSWYENHQFYKKIYLWMIKIYWKCYNRDPRVCFVLFYFFFLKINSFYFSHLQFKFCFYYFFSLNFTTKRNRSSSYVVVHISMLVIKSWFYYIIFQFKAFPLVLIHYESMYLVYFLFLFSF